MKLKQPSSQSAKSIYDQLDKRALLKLLESRDEEIRKLKARSIDDYIVDLILRNA